VSRPSRGLLASSGLALLLLAVWGCSPAGLLARAERAARMPSVSGGGCGEFTSEPRPVSVIVVNEDGEPLRDLRVTCYKSPVPAGTTARNGQVTLASRIVLAGVARAS